MVLTSEVAELATRIGQEIKAVYSQLAGKAAATHTHAAGDVASGTLAIARLPVAANGTSSTTAVPRADDSRLSNARTPTAHTHAAGDVNSGTLDIARLPVAANGTSSTTAVPRADDSRLSNARTPTGHAASHQSTGTDPVPAAIVYSYALPAAYTNVTGAYNSPTAVGTPLSIPDPGFPYILNMAGLVITRNGLSGTSRTDLSVRIGTITGTEIYHLTGLPMGANTFLAPVVASTYPATGKLTGPITLVLGAGTFPQTTGQVGGPTGPDNHLRFTVLPA